MPLTDAGCRAAKPKEKLYKLSDARGLSLSIHPGGGKYWTGAYRFGGKQKSLSLGSYPDVSLADAREQWEDARRLLKAGNDPAVEKQISKIAQVVAQARTFEIVAREWHAHMSASDEWGDGTAKENLHRLETDVFPVIGQDPIAKITPQRLLLVFREIEKRGALEIASRCRGMVSRIFNFAIVCGDTQGNPAAALKDVMKKPKKGHFASITVEEFPQFIKDLVNSKHHMFPATRVALWLMMRTFVRTTELIAVPWAEPDLERAIWDIPPERMKKGRGHVVPLSRQSVALFREMQPISGRHQFVFPNQRRPDGHMSDGAILKVLENIGYGGRMTGHGFRSLAMGVLKQELGYRHEVVDLQLSHAKGNKVDKAYDRAKFLAERTKMMQDWSDYIDRLVDAARPPLHLVA